MCALTLVLLCTINLPPSLYQNTQEAKMNAIQPGPDKTKRKPSANFTIDTATHEHTNRCKTTDMRLQTALYTSDIQTSYTHICWFTSACPSARMPLRQRQHPPMHSVLVPSHTGKIWSKQSGWPGQEILRCHFHCQCDETVISWSNRTEHYHRYIYKTCVMRYVITS